MIALASTSEGRLATTAVTTITSATSGFIAVGHVVKQEGRGAWCVTAYVTEPQPAALAAPPQAHFGVRQTARGVVGQHDTQLCYHHIPGVQRYLNEH